MIKQLFLLFFTINLSAQTVYKTPSGTKYHLANCRMVKNFSASISIQTASTSGLSPCKICRPPFTTTTAIISKPRKIAGENETSRCHGITKLGSRCKRKTKIGNDYCFQHLP